MNKKQTPTTKQEEVERSPFMKDLVEKIDSGVEFDYRILRGHVVECAKDQHGSRYI